ncbi:MAG: hypothetical protein ACI4GC_03085 [Acutalibacteraceae bacterium]
MKYCASCKKRCDTEEKFCLDCGDKLYDLPQDYDDNMNENEAAEIVSTMMITGIL